MTAPASPTLLPVDHLERVSSWGENIATLSYVYRPSTAEALADIFDLARSCRLTVGIRGAGCSYGDASLNREQITLDLTRMNRILDWNPTTGVMRVEPGVTIQQMWRHAIGDGWWPSVVPGTMFATVGGAAAANIHGKNHPKVGTIGEHIIEFDLLLPCGEMRRCSPSENPDVFHAAIGGFGLLGVMSSITLKLRKVHSGFLRVTPTAAANWAEMFAAFRARLHGSDYSVGWIDCFATGAAAGRGLIHSASYVDGDDDSQPTQSLRSSRQDPGDEVLGVLPKSSLYRLLKPVFHPGAMRLANAAQFALGSRKAGTPHYETHAAFAFMLDYVPNWKRAYGPGGLVQYQSFVPDADAEDIFRSQIERCQKAELMPLLSVFKRHRPDPFLLSYSLDGWSLALDFKHTQTNHHRLMRLFTEMDHDVFAVGGRFYFAKDSHLHRSRMDSYLHEPRVQRFLALKRELDPDNLLQTDLYRRIFSETHTAAKQALAWNPLAANVSG